jgi:hypothetical protein
MCGDFRFRDLRGSAKRLKELEPSALCMAMPITTHEYAHMQAFYEM